MKGLGIGAAAQGLMQGFQFMDGMYRQKRADERQVKLDERDAAREQRQIGLDGLRMDKARMDIDEARANQPLAQMEREKKQTDMEMERKRQANFDAFANASMQDRVTGGYDNTVGLINNLGGQFGFNVKGAETDPKTGKVNVTFINPDGTETVHAYDDRDSFETIASMVGDPTYAAKARQAKAEEAKKQAAEIAKEDRMQAGKVAIVQEQGRNAKEVARINADNRLLIAEEKLKAAELRGLQVSGDPHKRVQEYTKMFKEDLITDENGKRRKPTTTEANEMAIAIVSKQVPGFVPQKDSAPAHPAAGGIKPRPAPAAGGGLNMKNYDN